MVDVTGIEPVTPCLQSTRLVSTPSSYHLTTNVSNKSGNLLFAQS